MVANEVNIDTGPDAIVFEMLERMVALAANAEWARTERLAARLKSEVLKVPESARASLLMSVSQSLEQVQTMALVSRSDVAEKLGEIRRGRDATRAYGQPQSGLDQATLR